MRYLDLPGISPGSAAKLSELGFGCAALLGRCSRKESLAALATAMDAGVTFFDTARSYGYGGAEALLAEFLGTRRNEVVICTKFGILPANDSWRQKVKPLARAAIKAFPGLRAAAKRQAATQFVAGQFTLETLRTSFETSLRELRTDHVDMLLLHAAPESVLAQDDLLEAIGCLVESGKVLVAGISADQPIISRYFTQRPTHLQTAQFALNLTLMDFVAQTRQNADLLLVANHPFGGPAGNPAALIRKLRSEAALPASLHEKLTAVDPQLMPEFVLNCILRGTGISAVVPAMMQPQHIKSNILAVENCRFRDEELDLLRKQLIVSSPGGQ